MKCIETKNTEIQLKRSGREMSGTPETDKLMTDWVQGATKELPNFVEVARKLERERDALYSAAKMVLERWDQPSWKDNEPTSLVLQNLRAVMSAIKEGEK
jgi:hypothetical protein